MHEEKCSNCFIRTAENQLTDKTELRRQTMLAAESLEQCRSLIIICLMSKSKSSFVPSDYDNFNVVVWTLKVIANETLYL